MNSKVLVSGASGLVGSALVRTLRSSGWTVVSLVRPQSANRPNGEQIVWEPSRPLAPEAVSGFDAVVHLAGESIMGRWSSGKKARIMDSRVTGTRNLSQALAEAEEKPAVFISGSAIGYYGDRGDEGLTEASAPGTGFLAEVAEKWEEATTASVQADIRTAHIRTGIVLSTNGGALAAMLTPFKLGLGGRVGSGQQWMSWIDVQDMVGAIHHILKNDLIQGAVNLVAPKPVRNEEFAKTLANVLSRPAILPMPAFAVKAVFGEMGEALLLGSQRVEPGKLISSGYPFRYRELRRSLEGMLKR